MGSSGIGCCAESPATGCVFGVTGFCVAAVGAGALGSLLCLVSAEGRATVIVTSAQ
jgi:hypothetical protein